MQQQRSSFYALICLAFLFCGFEARADITLEASLSHLSFPVDQGAILNITVNGAGRVSAIELPEVPGITFQNRGQSSRINIINGSMASSLSNSYLLQVAKPGTYTIPPIKVTAGGETATTKPMSFEVTAGAQSNNTRGSADRSPDEVAFIRIQEISDHYPGEIVPIRIKAYFNQKYRADINSLPILHGDGVVMPQLREKPAQTEEKMNGSTYTVLFWDTTLSGIKAGKHPLTFSMEASLLIPQKRRPNSPFGNGLFDDSLLNDPFFDSFFGGAQRKPINVVSPEVIFNVIPLPLTNQPKDFTGAIGDFALKVSASRQNLEVGEPLQLSVEISGSGNFDRVEAPLFPEGPDWKTYTPAATFTSQGNSYTGVKIFDLAIVAKNDAVKEIPPLSLSYFDPVKKDYITRTSTPISIQLAKSATPLPSPPPPPQQSAAVSPSNGKGQGKATHSFEQLAALNLQMDNFQSRIVPLFAKGWFLGLVILCFLVLGTLLIWHVHRLSIKKHPERVLQRRKNQALANDLNLIEQACNKGNTLDFLLFSRTAIQNQMGLAWNVSASAISLADLRNRLGAESSLIEIFAATDAAAYGGATLSKEKMQSYLQAMKKELEGLP